MTEALMREKIDQDPDVRPEWTLMAGRDRTAVGFIVALIRETPEGERVGWIKLFCVTPAQRRQGTGTLLFDRIESELVRAGVQRIQVMDAVPNYWLPGIDPFCTEAVAFLERRGYVKIDDTANLIADLNQDLDTNSMEEEARTGGVVCRRARSGDLEEVIGMAGTEWPMWQPEIEAAFKSSPITLHLAFIDGRLSAFSAYSCNNISAGTFGPMGTLPRCRGKGVGGILLKRCLADLRAQGHGKAIIHWVGPIPFYMHYVNARVQHVFWRYQKAVDARG